MKSNFTPDGYWTLEYRQFYYGYAWHQKFASIGLSEREAKIISNYCVSLYHRK